MSVVRPVIEIFCSYAHEDEAWLHKLEAHLSPLKRQGLLTIWYDRLVVPGTDWSQTIDTHLGTASLVLLLISADFFASDYCYSVEMQRALQRHDANEAHVIPILLRPVDWQSAPFGKLKALPSNGAPITEWSNPDAAFTDVTQGIRVALEEIQHLTMGISPTILPHLWNLPYPRNPVFTGREEVLARLAHTLKVGLTVALSQPQAISGLGGIGKTQIATEYAYRYRQDYQAVFWSRADTRDALTSGFLAIAALLNLPEKDEQNQTIIIGAVLGWLKTHTQWLLILDNADDLALVREFLPPAISGHILFTTRAQAMGRLANYVEVEVMDLYTGALFLLRRAGLMAQNASLATALSSDVATAKEIVEEMGGLPLALDQAGAYIEETQCGLSDYQQRYRVRRAVLLKRRGGLIADHPESVATTWSLAFEKIKERNLAAADLLLFCAFLAPDAIPEEIIVKGAIHLGPLLNPLATDSIVLDEAIATLRAYSLIRRNPGEKTLSIHRLVQAVLRDTMSAEMKTEWVERMVRAVKEATPYVRNTTWERRERWLPHALACANWIDQMHLMFPDAVELLRETGWCLQVGARYAEAQPLLECVLAIREQHSGADHLETANALRDVAMLYFNQGRPRKAQPLLERALAIREQHLGADHLETASILMDLADVYAKQGYPFKNYKQMEPLLKRALFFYEQQLGADNPDNVACLNNLAVLYSRQHRYEEAEPLIQRVLEISEQHMGTYYLTTGTALCNLTTTYVEQGKYEQARPLLKRALTIFRSRLGDEHPETQRIKKNYIDLMDSHYVWRKENWRLVLIHRSYTKDLESVLHEKEKALQHQEDELATELANREMKLRDLITKVEHARKKLWGNPDEDVPEASLHLSCEFW